MRTREALLPFVDYLLVHPGGLPGPKYKDLQAFREYVVLYDIQPRTEGCRAAILRSRDAWWVLLDSARSKRTTLREKQKATEVERILQLSSQELTAENTSSAARKAKYGRKKK